MNSFLNKILALIILSLFACIKDNSTLHYTAEKGGIAITFDDCSTTEWCKVDSFLSKYNWRATFCISDYDECSIEDKSKLRCLQKNKHEIAGHGLHHQNAIEFVKKKGLSKYLDDEITPMLHSMESDSLIIRSFAYPYGCRDCKIDSALLNHFEILRGTTRGKEEPSMHNCFFCNSRIVYALGIDKIYEHASESYLFELLSYAKKNNKILVVYCHKPKEKVKKSYQVEFSTLEYICKFIRDNDMKFYTLSDLSNMIKY